MTAWGGCPLAKSDGHLDTGAALRAGLGLQLSKAVFYLA